MRSLGWALTQSDWRARGRGDEDTNLHRGQTVRRHKEYMTSASQTDRSEEADPTDTLILGLQPLEL